MSAIWYPTTADELDAGRRLYEALSQVSAADGADALAALDELGRTCVHILNRRYTDPSEVTVADLVRSIAPATAPVVARWAGVDPDDDEADRKGLVDDLDTVRDRTRAVREQLARVVPGVVACSRV